MTSMMASFDDTPVTPESWHLHHGLSIFDRTSMSDEKRPYRMTRRAESEERTRERITESAVALHGTLGPACTSISALADHAGVRRSTVYRHFPDDAALFAACSSHWRAANPSPDLAGWAVIADPDERLRHALKQLYGHYRRNERMLTNLLRDEAVVPILTQTLDGSRRYLIAAQQTLMVGRSTRRIARRRVQAVIGHAVSFHPWRSLAIEQRLNDREITELMCLLVQAAGDRASRTPSADTEVHR
jgi:AcrR family transcriptional regulator